jgi:hypothetical protein
MKHAQASQVEMSLADRVEAVGGSIQVRSPGRPGDLGVPLRTAC